MRAVIHNNDFIAGTQRIECAAQAAFIVRGVNQRSNFRHIESKMLFGEELGVVSEHLMYRSETRIGALALSC